MTVNYTSLLQLPQPVDGTEAGTWGDVLNNAQAAYLDIAIAGGLAVTVTTADVTLAATQGTSSATNIGSTTSQYAILNVSGAMTAARNLIVPSTSKWYIINNTCSGGFTLTVKGSATTGVGIANGEKALVAWNGSDFVKIATISGAGTFSSITNTGLTSGRVIYSTTGGLETDSANLLYSGTDLTVYGLTVGRGAGAVSGNTTLGASALAGGSQTGTSLTAIGFGTLNSNSSGNYNTAVGTSALQNSTTASDNTATGYQALYTNTTGADNSAFGFTALVLNTTGSSNTALGVQALRSNTTASNNTAVGYQALYANTTGSPSVAVGYQALNANITGANNVAVGYQTMAGNTTGGNNTALGQSALQFNNASNNTAVGYQAGYNTTSAASNCYFGYQAGYTLTATSGGNTFVGQQAGFAFNSASNGFHVMVGYNAGSGVTTGLSNTFLGANAGYAVTTGGKNVIIGAYQGSAAPISATGSNYIVLSDGDGNVRQVIDSSGNVGIGTTTLNGKLNVLTATDSKLIFNDGSTTGNVRLEAVNNAYSAYKPLETNGSIQIFATGATERMRIDTSGNVMVNTTSAINGKLSVYGGGPDAFWAKNDTATSSTVGVWNTATSGNNVFMTLGTEASFTQRGSITYNRAGGLVVYNTTSDYRAKTVNGSVENALEKVALLKPATGRMNGASIDIEFFVAHELQEVVPSAVTGEKDAVNEDGSPAYQMVDKSAIIPLLTAAIQEQQALIASLTARIAALETK